MSPPAANGTSIWQVAAVAVAASVSIGAGFWSLADPREALKEIRLSHVTRSVYEANVNRIQDDLRRVESLAIAQNKESQTKIDALQTKEAARDATLRLEARVDALVKEVEKMLPRQEFNGIAEARNIRIRQLEERVQALEKNRIAP